MNSRPVSLSELPAHLQRRVSGLPGRRMEYHPVGPGSLIGQTYQGECVYLVDPEDLSSDPTYRGWAIVSLRATGFEPVGAHILTKEELDLVDRIANEIADSAPIGRSGWRDRAYRSARTAVASRAVAWVNARSGLARQELKDAEVRRRAAAKAAFDARGEIRLHRPCPENDKSVVQDALHCARIRTENAVATIRNVSYGTGWRAVDGPDTYRVIDRDQPALVEARWPGDWPQRWTWSPADAAWLRWRECYGTGGSRSWVRTDDLSPRVPPAPPR